MSEYASEKDRFYTESNGLCNKLVGMLCTIVDATISDERQAKATKDLVKQTVWNTYDGFIVCFNSLK